MLRDQIGITTTNGVCKKYLPLGVSGVFRYIARKDDKLFIIDIEQDGKLHVINDNGVHVHSFDFPLASETQSIAINESTLYFGTSKAVYSMAIGDDYSVTNMAIIVKFANFGFNCFPRISIWRSCIVIVCHQNINLTIYDRNGNLVKHYVLTGGHNHEGWGLYDIDTDGKGNIFIADYTHGLVAVYSTTGRFIRDVLSTSGETPLRPDILYIHGNYLYVASPGADGTTLFIVELI